MSSDNEFFVIKKVERINPYFMDLKIKPLETSCSITIIEDVSIPYHVLERLNQEINLLKTQYGNSDEVISFLKSLRLTNKDFKIEISNENLLKKYLNLVL